MTILAVMNIFTAKLNGLVNAQMPERHAWLSVRPSLTGLVGEHKGGWHHHKTEKQNPAITENEESSCTRFALPLSEPCSLQQTAEGSCTTASCSCLHGHCKPPSLKSLQSGMESPAHLATPVPHHPHLTFHQLCIMSAAPSLKDFCMISLRTI